MPVTVSGLGGSASAIGGGSGHTCAPVGGTVECRGFNLPGQLGIGTTDDSASPQVVPGLADAGRAAVGALSTCAVCGGAASCCEWRM